MREWNKQLTSGRIIQKDPWSRLAPITEVSETDIGGLGYLGRMRYEYVIWKRECSRAHEVAGRIRHTFVSEQLCCIDIEQKEEHSQELLISGHSVSISLQYYHAKREADQIIKLHAVNCEKSIRYADHVPLSTKQNR